MPIVGDFDTRLGCAVWYVRQSMFTAKHYEIAAALAKLARSQGMELGIKLSFRKVRSILNKSKLASTMPLHTSEDFARRLLCSPLADEMFPVGGGA